MLAQVAEVTLEGRPSVREVHLNGGGFGLREEACVQVILMGHTTLPVSQLTWALHWTKSWSNCCCLYSWLTYGEVTRAKYSFEVLVYTWCCYTWSMKLAVNWWLDQSMEYGVTRSGGSCRGPRLTVSSLLTRNVCAPFCILVCIFEFLGIFIFLYIFVFFCVIVFWTFI